MTTITDIEASLGKLMADSATVLNWNSSERSAAAAVAGNSEQMVAGIERVARDRGVDAEDIRAAVNKAFAGATPSRGDGIEPIAKETAALAYSEVYQAARKDLAQDGLSGAALERQANLVAAEVSGLHQSGSGFLPIQYSCNGPTGIYGYLNENMKQIDGGSRNQQAFVPAPEAIASVMTQAQEACGGQRYPAIDRATMGGVPMTPPEQSASPTQLGGR